VRWRLVRRVTGNLQIPFACDGVKGESCAIFPVRGLVGEC